MQLFLLLLLATQGSATPLLPACEKNPGRLWGLAVTKENRVELTAPPAKKFKYEEKFGFDKVDVNNDGRPDFDVDMGSCGSDDVCVTGIFVDCGDGKHYLEVFKPDYYDALTIDPKNSVIVEGQRWQDFTDADGWRYRFDGNAYQFALLAKEYTKVLAKARRGNKEALIELARIAYPRLTANPGDLDLQPVKDALMDHSLVRKVLSLPGIDFDSFPDSLKRDKELLLIAIQHDAIVEYGHLPQSLLADREVAEAALRRHGDQLEMFPESVRSDPKLVELAVSKQYWALSQAGASIRGNRSLMLEWSKMYHIDSDGLPPALLADKEVARTFVTNNADSYRGFPENIRADKEIAEIALRRFGSRNLPYAPSSVKENRELLLEAARGDPESAKFFPESFFAEQAAVRGLICESPATFRHLPARWKADREIARIAATADSEYYFESPEALQADRGFALEIAKANPDIYARLRWQLRADKEIARAVFSRSSLLWGSAPGEIRNDPELAALVEKAPQYPAVDNKAAVAVLCRAATSSK